MKTVNFKYDIDNFVGTSIGTVGQVDMLGVDDGGIKYYVKTKDSSDWFKEGQLFATSNPNIGQQETR